MKKQLAVIFLLACSPCLAGTWAEVDASGKVLRVIVADQAFIDSGKVGDPKRWVETQTDGSKRANYAGVGYTYDKTKDVFIPPKPYSSWTLDVASKWQPPTPYPGGKAEWNETTRRWVNP